MKRSKPIRICSMLSVAIFFLTQVKSQDSTTLAKYYPKPKIYKIEFLFGPNLLIPRGIVDFKPDIKLKQTYHVGYSVGLGLRKDLNQHWSINARLLWDRRRYQVNQDLYNLNFYDSTTSQVKTVYLGTNVYDVTNDYLSISIAPQFIFKNGIGIGAGVYGGKLIGSTTSAQYFLPSFHQLQYNSIREYDDFDFGLSFSLYYAFTFKQLSFKVQIMDGYGLKGVPTRPNFVVQPPLNQSDPIPWYNNSYSILLGVSFLQLNNKVSHP